MSKLPAPAAPPQWADLVAFVAVLATGIVLIVFGHLTVAEVTSVCAAMACLYGAWKRFG